MGSAHVFFEFRLKQDIAIASRQNTERTARSSDKIPELNTLVLGVKHGRPERYVIAS